MLKSAVYRAEVLLPRNGRTCIIIALLLSLLARFLRDCTLLYMTLRCGVICDIRHKIQCKVSTNATNPASNDSTTKVNTYFDQFGVYVMLLKCYFVGKPTV